MAPKQRAYLKLGMWMIDPGVNYSCKGPVSVDTLSQLPIGRLRPDNAGNLAGDTDLLFMQIRSCIQSHYDMINSLDGQHIQATAVRRPEQSSRMLSLHSRTDEAGTI
jgi:hypothetical protein